MKLLFTSSFRQKKKKKRKERIHHNMNWLRLNYWRAHILPISPEHLRILCAVCGNSIYDLHCFGFFVFCFISSVMKSKPTECEFFTWRATELNLNCGRSSKWKAWISLESCTNDLLSGRSSFSFFNISLYFDRLFVERSVSHFDIDITSYEWNRSCFIWQCFDENLIETIKSKSKSKSELKFKQFNREKRWEKIGHFAPKQIFDKTFSSATSWHLLIATMPE